MFRILSGIVMAIVFIAAWTSSAFGGINGSISGDGGVAVPERQLFNPRILSRRFSLDEERFHFGLCRDGDLGDAGELSDCCVSEYAGIVGLLELKSCVGGRFERANTKGLSASNILEFDEARPPKTLVFSTR